jgi:hypothetical protein
MKNRNMFEMAVVSGIIQDLHENDVTDIAVVCATLEQQKLI